MIYSEHLIATVQELTRAHYSTGADMDAALTRPAVQIGKIIGADVGSNPSDSHLAWWAQAVGESCPIGTRCAIHILPGNRIGLGLGSGRGVIESTGDHLGVVHHPQPGRYLGAYLLPTIVYGGLV